MANEVFTKATSRKMRQLLRLSVLEGTGKAAAARGYLVGGKTGSAEKEALMGMTKTCWSHRLLAFSQLSNLAMQYSP